ncbi:MAG: dimethylmenaquinone methyltransferase [Gemmataceae bacterium]
MPASELSQATLKKLAQYDTPTICNVVELFDVRPRTAGYLDSRVRACFPDLPPMVGYASTATFRASTPPRKGDVYSSLSAQIEAFASLPGPVVVVFQDLDVPSVAATFGEIMCTTYKAFGAVGLITSGAGRDLDQVRALPFPCFTTGTICAHGYCHIPQIHIPVTVGGVTIYPGDLIHGDRNGVTTIPLDIASEVADACAEYVAAEAIVLEVLRQSSLTPQAFAEARKASQAKIEELASKLRRRV